MTPAARLQAAIDILASLEGTDEAADSYLRHWARANRYAGAKDRAAIAERVYLILRRRAEFSWRIRDAHPRAWVLGSLAAGDRLPTDDIALLFSGGGHGPAPLTEAERDALDAAPMPMSPEIAGNYPAWLSPELERAFGAALPDEAAAWLGRAPVDLRVNTLKAARGDVLPLLRADGLDAAETPFARTGLRIAPAQRAPVQDHKLFETGAVEVQDEGAQIAAALCAARPGETAIDLAAGAGGKSLALAAAMANRGRIVATDIAPGRLARLAPRAARAGATMIETAAFEALGDLAADLVVVDAPCSGSGTWRRNPETKWRLTEAKLAAYRAAQADLLARAARLVRPGGRIAYVTCSLLPSENEDQAAAFLAAHPDFRALDARALWPSVLDGAPPARVGESARLSPASGGTDGFFVALFARLAAPADSQ